MPENEEKEKRAEADRPKIDESHMPYTNPAVFVNNWKLNFGNGYARFVFGDIAPSSQNVVCASVIMTLEHAESMACVMLDLISKLKAQQGNIMPAQNPEIKH